MKRTRVEQHLGNGRNVPHFATGWSRVTYFDVLAAVFISLVVQMTMSLIAASVPVLAPAVAAERGWSPSIVAVYPIVVYVTAFLISFHVPELLFRLGGMGLNLASLIIGAAGLLFLLPPFAAAVVLGSVAIGCGTAAMNPASLQMLGPRTTARTAGLVMSIKQTGVPLGGVMAGALVPILVAHFGWRMATIELAAIGLVLAIAFGQLAQWRFRSCKTGRLSTVRSGQASPRHARHAHIAARQPHV
jgi:Major Facilitator Superfamily